MTRVTGYRNLSDNELLGKLADLSRYNQKAAFVLAQLTDDDVYNAVTELRRRCALATAPVIAEESRIRETGRAHDPHSIPVDGIRWKEYFFSKGLRLGEVGPLVGLSKGFAYVVRARARHLSSRLRGWRSSSTSMPMTSSTPSRPTNTVSVWLVSASASCP